MYGFLILNNFSSLKKKGFFSPEMNPIWGLLVLLGLKTFIFFIGITSPIPAGVFGPFMLLGAVLGRAYGESLSLFFGVTNIGKFAVAGSAAVSAMSTRFFFIYDFLNNFPHLKIFGNDNSHN